MDQSQELLRLRLRLLQFERSAESPLVHPPAGISRLAH
jgi:hypothetical protein